MNLKKCPICGGDSFSEEKGFFICDYCNSKFDNQSSQKYASQYQKACDNGLDIEIGNLRFVIDSELEKSHPSKEIILHACSNIRKVYPEDNVSIFYQAFLERTTSPKNYELVLSSLEKANLQDYEKEKILPFVVKFADYRTKDSIEKLLKSIGEWKSYAKELEKALEERKREIDRFTPFKDVFICHSSKDIQVVREIVKALEENTISTWISEDNMPWDIERYDENIQEAIENCKVFLVVLSDQSKMSPDCMKEVKSATMLNKPIRVEYRIDKSENNIPLKHFFDGIQWIDGSNGSQVDLLCERIFNQLQNEGGTKSSSNSKKPAKKQEENLNQIISNFSVNNNSTNSEIIQLGSYQGMDLTWKIVHKRENGTAVALCTSCFNTTLTKYDIDDVKSWLNEDFCKFSFSEQIKNNILYQRKRSPSNVLWPEWDKIFIPSFNELNSVSIDNRISSNKETKRWITRSSEDDNYICCDSEGNLFRCEMDSDSDIYVKPAINIVYDKEKYSECKMQDEIEEKNATLVYQKRHRRNKCVEVSLITFFTLLPIILSVVLFMNILPINIFYILCVIGVIGAGVLLLLSSGMFDNLLDFSPSFYSIITILIAAVFIIGIFVSRGAAEFAWKIPLLAISTIGAVLSTIFSFYDDWDCLYFWENVIIWGTIPISIACLVAICLYSTIGFWVLAFAIIPLILHVISFIRNMAIVGLFDVF